MISGEDALTEMPFNEAGNLMVKVLNTRILIVGHRASESATIKHILKRQMDLTRVEHVHNGAEAMTELHSSKFHRYDLIILTLQMPDADAGLDLLEEIRSDKEIKSIPVLVVTGEMSGDEKMRMIECGVNGILPKPFTGNALEKEINRILSAD